MLLGKRRVSAHRVQVIGERLHCVFVDNGLLRLEEGDRVMKTFAEQLHLPVTKIDARASMMARLKGVTDPEAKRKAIGAEFIDCFKRFRCACLRPPLVLSATWPTSMCHVCDGACAAPPGECADKSLRGAAAEATAGASDSGGLGHPPAPGQHGSNRSSNKNTYPDGMFPRRCSHEAASLGVGRT